MKNCVVRRIRSLKWCSFQVVDFRSLMYPCLCESLVMGLFPCKSISSPPYFQYSKLRSICSTIVIVIYAVHLLDIVYHVNISGSMQYDSIPGTLQGNCYIILGGSVALITYINGQRRMILLRSLAVISSQLPPATFDSLSKVVYTKDIAGFMFLIGQAIHIPSEDINISRAKVNGLYTTLLIFIMDMMYMDCVCVLKASFEKINEGLLGIKRTITTDEPHVLRRIYHERKNPLLLLELKGLKRRHQEISNVLEMLNETFSMHIMCTVTLSFVEITFSLYFFLLQNLGDTAINLEKQIWYSYFITSVAYYGAKMIMIIWACETGKKEATRTGVVVHEVLVVTEDKQLREELQIFSLQALHRGNTFTATGLTVDAKLLTGLVGSITTYLLILIQFLIAMHPCDENDRQRNATTASTTSLPDNNR